MKIIYLDQYYNNPGMPGGTRSFEMAKRLVYFGHEVHIITSWRENDGKKESFCTEEAGFKVHWLPVPYSNKMAFYDRIKAFVVFAFFAACQAIKLDGDVIFATSTPLTIAIPGIIASKIKRLPLVFEVRDLWPELPIAIGALKNPIAKLAAKVLEKIAYYSSTYVVALSPGMVEGVLKTGYSKNRVFQIPNSCDLDLFKFDPIKAEKFREKYSWIKDRPLVVYCGTLGEINGVEFLAEVAFFTARSDKNICFLIIGSGKMEKFVKSKAEELDVLNRNFYVLDELPKQEIVAAFSAATISTSVFVDLPQMWANSANKFFDSLAAGKPIMINYSGWQKELLETTGAGFVVDVKKPEEAAKNLIEKISDADWLKSASIASLKLAREKFSRDFLAKQLEKVLLKAKTEFGW